jgi:hypothetical protein
VCLARSRRSGDHWEPERRTAEVSQTHTRIFKNLMGFLYTDLHLATAS